MDGYKNNYDGENGNITENDGDTIPFQEKVREDLILLGVEGETRDEILKVIADAFVAKGVVKPTFYQALLERENQYPTGLPTGEINVAIPHTYPEHVNEMAVGMAVLKKPVAFRNMGNPSEELQVSLVVCLALKKMDDNIKMLPSLMDFFLEESNLKSIMTCNSAEEIMSLMGRR
jgi:PTS system galactitol-specific IIA component